MIVKGASRSSVSYWSKHLLRTDHNEQVEVLETAIWHEDTSQAVYESLHHFQQMSRLTEKGEKGLYCAHIDPDGGYEMTPQHWQASVATLEAQLGLSGQPRLMVKHVKDGRDHLHVVWQRTQQLEDGKFILVSDSYNYKHHELAARQMEIDLGHEPVKGVFTGRDRDPETGHCRDERPVARLHHQEWQQGERIKAAQPDKNAQAIKAELAQLWQQTDSGQAFKAALTQAGYTLARGDKKAIHMVVDPEGEAYDLRRSLPGVKKKELEVRLGDNPAATLSTVGVVREQLERERGWFDRLERDGQVQAASRHAVRMEIAQAQAIDTLQLAEEHARGDIMSLRETAPAHLTATREPAPQTAPAVDLVRPRAEVPPRTELHRPPRVEPPADISQGLEGLPEGVPSSRDARAKAPLQRDDVPDPAQPDAQPSAPPSDRPWSLEERVARGHAVVRARLETARAALEQRTGEPHQVAEGGPVQGRLIERVPIGWTFVARLKQAVGYLVAPWRAEMERYLGQEVRLQLGSQGTFVHDIEAVPSEPSRDQDEVRAPEPALPPPSAATPPLSQTPQPERWLPNDLAALESMWQSETAWYFGPVQAKAHRVEDKARLQLKRHDEAIKRHQAAEPQAPGALLALFRQHRYEQDLEAWQGRDKAFHWRWLQLRERVKAVAEYGRQGITGYPSKGEQLAQKRLRAEQPDLERKLVQAREEEHQRRSERLRQETEQRRQRERDRGLER